MKILSRHPRLGLGLTSLALAVSIASPTHAQAQRRDFSGKYRLSDVVHSGDFVSLTITLKLFNYSGSEIHDAGIVLYDDAATNHLQNEQADPVGAFNIISTLPSYKAVTLQHRFQVSAKEYTLWQHGHKPELVFLKPDDKNGAQAVPVDLQREFTNDAQEQNSEVAR